MRECAFPNDDASGDCPEEIASYWRANVPTHPYFNPDVECFTVILLNSRHGIKGHHLISQGTLDTILVHPREVFRAAVIGAASAVVIVHNHPSGDPTPSEADIRITRELIRAGLLLKLTVLDHLVMGRATEQRAKDYVSLRERGYCYEHTAHPLTLKGGRLTRLAHLRKVHRMGSITAGAVAETFLDVMLADLPAASALLNKFIHYCDAEGFTEEHRRGDVLQRRLEQPIPRKKAARTGGAR